MPQMAPLSWTLLFMFFTMMLLAVSTMNYYTSTPSPMKSKGEMIFQKKLTMNWKW